MNGIGQSTIERSGGDPVAARTNLLGLDRAAMEAFFVALGEKPFRAAQMLKWIHQRRVTDFEHMTNFSKGLRARLAGCAEIRPPVVVSDQRSADGTRKWLIAVDADNCIETVFIPDSPRGTLCVSSQVGCALNCTFCATAEQGFNRNLDAAEIIGQLWLASRALERAGTAERVITNVVLMGMGEPLLNFDHVVVALDLMLEDLAYGLARRRVTLSTAGVVPGLRRLKSRCPVSLAVSLHAPNDALRDRLVPLNRSFPIGELLETCRDYVAGDPRQKITFEYVMLDGINDTADHARELARLLRDLPAKVNLIPFNSYPFSRYRRSPVEAIDRFRDILLAEGVMTITRKTRGDDIDAACGQLAGRVRPKSRRVALRRTGRLTRAAEVRGSAS